MFVDNDDLYWLDLDTDQLIASSNDRPTNPRVVDLPKEVPWYDNNGTEKIVLMEFRINVGNNEQHTVKNDTAKVIIDIDFSNSGTSVTDVTSDITLMKTLDLPFLEADNSSSELLTATLTVLEKEQVGGDNDPEP